MEDKFWPNLYKLKPKPFCMYPWRKPIMRIFQKTPFTVCAAVLAWAMSMGAGTAFAQSNDTLAKVMALRAHSKQN